MTEQIIKFALLYILDTMNTKRDNERIGKNAVALKVTWFILIASLSFLGFSLYQQHQNYKLTQTQSQFMALIEAQQTRVIQLTVEINHSMDSDESASSVFKVDITERLADLKQQNKELVNPVFIVGITESEMEVLSNKDVKLGKIHNSFEGITNLVINRTKGVFENQQIIKSQLSKSSLAYLETLQKLEHWSLKQLVISNNSIYQLDWIFAGMYSLLALLGYLQVIRPLGKNFRNTEEVIIEWKEKIGKNEIKLLETVQKEKANSLILKTKIAQVQKLQESLELALNQASKAKQDKNLVYHNAATDLSGYINVMNLQKEIIENQTNMTNNENWSNLRGSISQLNSLVGDYFNRAKMGVSYQNQSEVYLSQLVSEILLSIPNKEKIEFEQVTDMPCIKTNVELLTRVLLPYFEMISSCQNNGKIMVSATENGEACEMKFIGLSPMFKQKWAKMEQKVVSDLDFDEFKIHMSGNTINERGGRQWLQFDQGETGVFTINWIM